MAGKMISPIILPVIILPVLGSAAGEVIQENEVAQLLRNVTQNGSFFPSSTATT